jgi:hypothetical protein
MIGTNETMSLAANVYFTVYATDWSDETGQPRGSPVQKAPTRTF